MTKRERSTGQEVHAYWEDKQLIHPVLHGSWSSLLLGAVPFSLPNDWFPALEINVPKDSVQGKARWDLNRRRVPKDPFATGAEGYFLPHDDPAQRMVDLVKSSVALTFDQGLSTRTINPQSINTALARKERTIHAFIETLQRQGSLTQREFFAAHQLLQVVIARFRAEESRLAATDPKAKKLYSDYRNTANSYLLKAHPNVQYDWNSAVVWNWTQTPDEIVQVKDVRLSVSHLSEVDHLVMEILNELGRFGDPIVRSYVRLCSQHAGLR